MQDILDRIIKLVDTEDLLISHIPGSTNTAVIVFSGASVSHEAFVSDAVRDDNYIFISERTFQWGHSLDVDYVLNTIAPYILDKRIVCVGMSMGGFLAIIFSNLLNASACLAFVPQYSPFKKYLGTSYWGESSIKGMNPLFATISFNTDTYYTIFTTDDQLDIPHNRHMLKELNAEILVYTLKSSLGFTHLEITRKLKDYGALDKIIQDVVRSNQVTLPVEQILYHCYRTIHRRGTRVYSR
jgi:hypothetical protein